ncbi:MAG: hemerythrin domain-containing protein [Burkholderiaceae bacterium]
MNTPAAPAPHPNAEPAAPKEPPALIAHILRRYHDTHRAQLVELQGLATKVEAAQAQHPELPAGLSALLQTIAAELHAHMAKEETILFPMLARGGHPFAARPIAVMRSEHVSHGERLAQLLALTRAATPPADAGDDWRRLYTGLRTFVDDVQAHIRLENDVLFPPFEARPA